MVAPTIGQTVVTLFGALVLAWNLILRPLNCLDVSIRSMWHLNHPQMYIFYHKNIDSVTISMPKGHFAHGLFKADIMTKSMFWGQNKYICRLFECHVDLMDTLNHSECSSLGFKRARGCHSKLEIFLSGSWVDSFDADVEVQDVRCWVFFVRMFNTYLPFAVPLERAFISSIQLRYDGLRSLPPFMSFSDLANTWILNHHILR